MVARLIFAFLLFFHVSCKHDPFETPPVEEPKADTTDTIITPIDTATYDPAKVYFVNDIQPILNSNCAIPGCHNHESKADGIDLSNYDRIMKTTEIEPGKPDKGKLMKVITESDPAKRMPPSGPLPPDKIELIKKWIEQGAKNNVYTSKGCDTTLLKFGANILSIFDNHCKSCHNINVKNGGYDLSDYAGIKSAVDANLLPGSIEHISGFKAMPPGNKIPDCDISKIQRWILNGAPNN
jgi:hypothetical protein